MNRKIGIGLLVVVLTGLSLLSQLWGRYPISCVTLWHWLSGTLPATQATSLHLLFVQIRLPRLLTALLVGSALACSGATFQAVFRNPLAAPDILGVMGGAAFGGALGIVLGGPWWSIQLSALCFGLLAVAMAFAVARHFSGQPILMLVMGGILAGALFTGLLSLVKYAADPYQQLPSIVFWLMGSLSELPLTQIVYFALPIFISITVLIFYGPQMDALSLGDEEAHALGLRVHRLRLLLVFLATLLAALAVVMAGMIGWIGLIVPHLARLLLGPGNRRLILGSALLGAAYLLLADSLARNLLSVGVPVGIFAELLGVPAFLVVLRQIRKAWN
ncbi:MAG: iron ABC transporter permease [Acidithiobacillus sp.]|nr:iron ABC transporter permease [Acidithiobacillus sp.]